MKLSFIIPFYNGDKYFSECIDSLYNQDVPETEYEVIVVDDCSTDKDALSLVEKYAHSHPTMRVIHNSCNLRCGISRNVGLQHAMGDYVWFVDQDDYIVPNCLGGIIQRCCVHDLDILYFDFYDVRDDHIGDKKQGVVSQESPILTGLDYISEQCDGDFWNKSYDTNVWHALYRRDFMVGNRIFSPGVSYCEDLIVAQHAIISANRMMAVPTAYYCYRNNPESVFHTAVGVKGRLLFDGSLYSGVELCKLSNLIPQNYSVLKKTVREGGIYRMNSFTKKLLKISREQRKVFFDMVRKHKDVVKEALLNLNGINKWIITHPKCVRISPRAVYAYIKLCQKWR